MGLVARTRNIFLEQRGSLFPWVPVGLAVGIGLYFSLPAEPDTQSLAVIAVFGVICVVCALRGHAVASIFFWAGALVAAGVVLAAWRAHDRAAPVIGWRYYGPVEGRVAGLDRSASDALRITLDQVRLKNVSPLETPARVRISLHGVAADGPAPQPGARVMTTAHISPPGGPVEPGGFDFQRHAWFRQLGGVGYTRVPLLMAAPPERGGLAQLVFRVRMALSDHMRAVLPGNTGGFAAAVTTGDRSGMSQQATEALRASNLSHLLAISGLHMGLLTGFVYAVLRLALALVPWVALRWPVRRLAAIGALAAGAIYLALSGGNVATERAFTMVAVALVALMLGRQMLSLRAVAIAATIVLILRPEALLGPGFQMSFAATTGLVAFFGALREAQWPGEAWPKWARQVLAVVLSSGVAGLATAPFAAAHFNALAHYGLPANVISVPVMGALVVPAAVIALCVAPFGLADPVLRIMGLGLDWILGVAHLVAAQPGARSFVAGPDWRVVPLLAIGALIICLWQGRGRWAGVLPVIIGFALWTQVDRPDVLIAENGTLVGVMTPEGRALNKARGAGFVAGIWLENDGERIAQADAFARWPGPSKNRRIQTDLGPLSLWHLAGKKAAADLPSCENAVIVASVDIDPPSGCTVFDPARLRNTGAIALRLAGKVQITTARNFAGDRLWSQWPQTDP